MNDMYDMFLAKYLERILFIPTKQVLEIFYLQELESLRLVFLRTDRLESMLFWPTLLE